MVKKTMDLVWPVALNTVDNQRILLPAECSDNTNWIKSPSGDIRAHYPFEAVTVADTLRLIYGVPFKTRFATEQLIVFGVDADGGFIGVIEYGSTTLTKLLTELDGTIVPAFVEYKEKLYIFLGDVYVYDGTELVESEDFEAVTSYIACEFRERLFWAEAGVLYYTDVLGDTPIDNNYFMVGLVDEPITALWPDNEGIWVLKRDELWDLHFPTAYIEDVYLRPRNKESGASNNTAAVGHFDTLLMANNRGVYLMDPKSVIINPQRIIEVSAGVARISDPVDDIYRDFYHRTISTQTPFKKLHTATSGTYFWNVADFPERYEIEVDTNDHWHDYTGVRITANHLVGWGVVPLTLGSGQKWSSITGLAWYEQSASETDFYIGVKDSESAEYEIFHPTKSFDEEENCYFYRWQFDVPGSMRHSTNIWVKFSIVKTILGTGPFMHDMAVYTMPTSGALFLTGFCKDTFYLSGDTYSGERQLLAYRNGGWLKVAIPDFTAYGIVDEIPWSETYSIVGFGENEGVGQLLKLATPEVLSGVTVVDGETGNIDHGAPDVPKQLRKIFICYKGSGSLVFYDDHGNSNTASLTSQTEFQTKEFSFQTCRSKWFRYKIYGTDASFSVRMPIRVVLKLYGPDEE